MHSRLPDLNISQSVSCWLSSTIRSRSTFIIAISMLFSKIMAFILDGNTENVAHAYRKVGIFGEKKFDL